MDDIDRKILTIISRGFPLEERPYLAIARQAGITEDEAGDRVSRLRASGVIRRIGAVIIPASLGWHSTLCAVDLPEERIEEFAALVNAYDEVTHNYVRSGHPNCWFTLIVPDASHASGIIRTIERELGTKVLDLPARRVFKIRVSFDLEK